MTRTVVFSLLLSLIASIAAAIALFGQKAPEAAVLRAHRVEILDENNATRLVLEASHNCSCLRILTPSGISTLELGEKTESAGVKEGIPRLVIRDSKGVDLSLLTVDIYGKSVLVFNSDKKEGKVMVGHLGTSDTVPPGDMGAWGLQVLGSDHASTGLGFMDSGKLIRPIDDGPKQGRVVPTNSRDTRNSVN